MSLRVPACAGATCKTTLTRNAMEFRTGIQLTRILVEGPAACRTVAQFAPGFDAERLARFLTAGNLRDWFTPLLDHPPAPALLAPAFANDLRAARRSAAPQRALLDLSRDVRDAVAIIGSRARTQPEVPVSRGGRLRPREPAAVLWAIPETT